MSPITRDLLTIFTKYVWATRPYYVRILPRKTQNAWLIEVMVMLTRPIQK